MRKRKFLIIFTLIIKLCSIPIFADTVKSNNYDDAPQITSTWVNAPFVKMLTQFCNMEERWIVVARDIAVVMVILNIIWQCIQIAFGTMEVRKALVSSLTKWFLFLFIMCMYPAFNVGLLNFSQQVARKMSNDWTNDIGNDLASYYESLYQTVKKKGTEQSVIVGLKQQKIEELVRNKSKYVSEAEMMYSGEGEAMYNIALDQAKIELESAKNLNAGDVSVQTYNILQDIFSVTTDAGDHVTSWNIMLNCIFSKTYMSPDIVTKANGKSALGHSSKKKATIHIISPDAILKTIYLCAAVMWEREWTATNQEWISNQEETDKNATGLSKAIAKRFTIVDFPMHRLAEMIFCIVLIIFMIICGSTAIIQYMMSLLEYTLVAGACAILIPFMLFDGLNDMAQKVISILFQQAIKLIFCIIICTFCVWCYFLLAEQTVGAVTGLSMQNIVFGLFISLIGGAFMTNAPKIASVLATGTPQMSMGEFAQMGYAYARAGHFVENKPRQAVQLVKTASKLNKGLNDVNRKVVKGGIDAAGQIGRNVGAAKGAYRASRDAGFGVMDSIGKGMGAGIKQDLSDGWRRTKGAAFDWINGGSGKGGGGGRSGGTGAQSSLNLNSDKWTNTSYNENVKDSKKNMQTPEAHNLNYGQAMHYETDEHGNHHATRPQTLKEYLKTQKEDAYNAAMERYSAGLKKREEEKNK